MIDSAALAKQLAELLKQQAHTVRFRGDEVWHKNLNIASFTLTNQSAILRALCVMAAVEESKRVMPTDWLRGKFDIDARADELLAECAGAKS